MINEWVLVFDTETTGIGPDYRKLLGYNGAKNLDDMLMNGLKWEENVGLWKESKTYIAQLSYIMYNLQTNEYKLFNKFITDIPSVDVEFLLEKSPRDETGELSDIVYEKNPKAYTHPISARTLEKMRDLLTPAENKATISEALTEFIEDVGKASVITAHNAAFDRRLVFYELMRLNVKDSLLFDKFLNAQSKIYCTMCMSKEIAHIDTKVVKGEMKRMPYFEKEKVYPNPKSTRYEFVEIPAIKSPALWEVYDRMFGYPLIEELMHDALNDVVACLRVFYRLWMTGNREDPVNPMICGRGAPDIYGMDSLTGGEITERINSITPSGIDAAGNFPTDGLGSCFVEGKPYSRIPKTHVLSWQQMDKIERNRVAALERQSELKRQKMSGIGGEKSRKTLGKKRGKRQRKRTIKRR
jgi:DNA polymerase III epsilon subunit-like protein